MTNLRGLHSNFVKLFGGAGGTGSSDEIDFTKNVPQDAWVIFERIASPPSSFTCHLEANFQTADVWYPVFVLKPAGDWARLEFESLGIYRLPNDLMPAMYRFELTAGPVGGNLDAWIVY
jgi:hypothetical protein